MNLFRPSSWGGAGLSTKDASDSELSLDRLIEKMDAIRNTASGIRITPTTALQSPSVFAICTRLGRAVASLPFRVLKDESELGKRRVQNQPNHQVAQLLGRRPNPDMTPYEYWSLAMIRLLLWGIFYAEKETAGGRIVSLKPLNPSHVRAQPTPGGLVYDVTDSDSVRRVPAMDMHVIRAFSLDGKTGTTPVQQCSETIALEIAAQEFGATVFGSGAIPNVVLYKEGKLKDKAAIQRLKDSWNEAFKKKRGTAVLEDGFKLETVQMSNEESQFLETRKFQRSVIAGAWGIPPHMIGDLERATFSNIEELDIDFVRHALRPYLTCIEQAVDRDLIGDLDLVKGVHSKFDVSDILRGDIKTRSEALRTMREEGVINANEWRAMEGMDAREDPGGDDYITPLNFRVEDASGDASSSGDTGTGGATVVAMRRLR